jgi:hypothetical protein
VNLSVTAALDGLEGSSTQGGTVNGFPITAAHLRDLLRRLGAMGLTTPEGGTLTLAITDGRGRLIATVTPTELQRLAKRGCAEHRDGDCGCALIDLPPATDAYPPTDRQRSFVTTRDRTCRMPNCGQRIGWADLDHVVAHARGGQTTCTNLCCLCRSHHRLKTFARGWRFQMSPDGILTVTTPSGITRSTRPPGLRPPPPDDTRPPEPPEPEGTGSPDDDPPPF